jgi:hypothetical protein
MNGRTIVNTKPVDLEIVFGALIAYPKDEDAKAFIEEHGYDISLAKVQVYRRGSQMVESPYFEPYQKRREQLAPRLEAKLADDMLSNAARITSVEAFCIEQVEEQLANGEVKDPARVARDLSQVRSQQIEKRLALQGRPTHIVEKRSVDELVKALEGKGLATQVDAESTAEEITDDKRDIT